MKRRSVKGWMIFLSFVFITGCAVAVIPSAAVAAEVERQEFYVTTDTGMKLMLVAKIPASGRLGKAILLVHGSGWDGSIGISPSEIIASWTTWLKRDSMCTPSNVGVMAKAPNLMAWK